MERAHIRHLIEYDSLNIFHIWIPSTNKIICTKNVVFNKTSFYNPNDVNFYETVKKPMLKVYKFESVTIQQFSTIKINSNNNIEIRNGTTKLQTLETQTLKIQQKKHNEKEITLEFFDQNKYPFTLISKFISTLSMQFFTL